MPAAATKNPVSDLMYNWLAILKHKAEGVDCYDKYIKDAKQADSSECVDMLKKLKEEDIRILEELKSHVFGMIAREHVNQ
jgi:hypothetical protein